MPLRVRPAVVRRVGVRPARQDLLLSTSGAGDDRDYAATRLAVLYVHKLASLEHFQHHAGSLPAGWLLFPGIVWRLMVADFQRVLFALRLRRRSGLRRDRRLPDGEIPLLAEPLDDNQHEHVDDQHFHLDQHEHDHHDACSLVLLFRRRSACGPVRLPSILLVQWRHAL